MKLTFTNRLTISLWLTLILAFLFVPKSYSQELSGKVIDKDNAPIEFANIFGLAKDSTFINGAVTDSCGKFVIPNAQQRYCLIKISAIGYKTKVIPVIHEDIGNIILEDDNVMLGEVVVKSKRPRYKRIHGGYSTNIQNTVYEKLENADEVLGHLPRVSGSNGQYNIFGKGQPVIYIRGRPLNDVSELRQLKTSDIDKVTVLTSPGVKYDSEIKSVIIIKTKKAKGEGLSGNVEGVYNQSFKAGYSTSANLNWRSHNLDFFGGLTNSNNYRYNKEEIEQNIYGGKNNIQEKMNNIIRSARSKEISGKLGLNYLLNDSNSIGLQYHIYKNLRNQYGRVRHNDEIIINNNSNESLDYDMQSVPENGPTHELDAYYNGKLGKANIAFDGTYYKMKTQNVMNTEETDNDRQSYGVNSVRKSESHYNAAKLVVDYPLLDNFTVEGGIDFYNSHIDQDYINREGIIASTNNTIKENNIAGFANLDYTLGSFDISAGLRYENIYKEALENHIKNAYESRTYNKFFPNIDLSYNGESFNLGLSYEVTSTKPTYGQLSNIVSYDSRYLYEGGNPDLKMTIEHNIELSAMYKFLALSLSYEYDRDPIVQWGKLYKNDDDIVLLTNINIHSEKSLTFTLTAQPTIGHWYPSFEFDFQKQYIDHLGLNYNFNKPIYQLAFNNLFAFKTLLLSVNYMYHSSGADGYNISGSYQKFDASLTKYFFGRKLYVKLQSEDIFKSSMTASELHTNSYNVKSKMWPSYRNITLTIGFNFNKTRKRYSGVGAGTEVKNRL